LATLSLINAYQEFNQGHYGKAMTTFFESDVDPLKVIALYGNLLPLSVRGQHNKFPIVITELKGAASNRALMALSNYLEKKRTQVVGALKKDDKGPDPDAQQVPWPETVSVPQIIDTVLLKSYLLTNPTLVSSLMKLPNYCHVKECESILIGARKYTDLILLYRSRGLHQNALDYLAKLGQEKDFDYPGTKAAIDYLKTLGRDNLELLLNREYTDWIFSQNAIEALTIYTVYRKQPLPADKVLGHLEDMEKRKIISNVLVIKYLEHIYQSGDTTPDFHNKLVFRYFDIVLTLKQKARLADPNIAKMTAGTEPPPLGEYRSQLLDFLEESEHYTAASMLSKYSCEFSDEGLHEERAIILSKIGRHYEALREYVHNLHDLTMAEKYCQKHYNPEHEENRAVYLNLLKVYMTKPPGADEHIIAEFQTAAFELINKHFKEIDVPAALSLLPPETPISKIYPFLERVLQDTNKERCNKLIQLNLQNSERMKKKAELLKLRSNFVKITEETLCDECGAPIKDAIFSRYPDGSILHYKCTILRTQREGK